MRSVVNCSMKTNMLRYLVLLALLATVESQGTDLGGGIVTRTDVQSFANLALDVRDIKEYALSGQVQEIQALYTGGQHSQRNGERFSLKQLNDDLTAADPKTPNFLFQLYGLADLSSDLNRTLEHKNYAYTYIQQTISDNPDLVADSIVALSMWMYATHLLYEGVKKCDDRMIASNPSLIQFGGGGMDEFIALWIGSDQTSLDSDGHSLYAWAQQAGQLFNTASPEARVNSRIKLLYEEGAAILTLNKNCTKENEYSVEALWKVVVQITNEMMKPLFQWLIYHILEQNHDEVKLYATALVPQISSCRPSLFKRLKSNLLDTNVDFAKTSDILKDLKEAFFCFDFTCADVGDYGGDARLTCDDVRYQTMAGYIPSSPVGSLSRIDLDIHALKILTSLESYKFAKLLYSYGQNVETIRLSNTDPFNLLSLHLLATTNFRSYADPLFTQFVTYYDSRNYADDIVMDTLRSSGKWGRATPQQKAEVVALTASFQIVFLQTVVQLQDAVRGCRASDPDIGFSSRRNPLDEAAAFLIGSMEGKVLGGSGDFEDGQLLWGLANGHAFQFRTMNEFDYADVNADIVNLLYAARGELEVLDCTRLEISIQKVQTLMLVGLFQAIMRSAIMAHSLPSNSSSITLVQGEMYTLAVLPIIDKIDHGTADDLAESMVVRPGVKPVKRGPQAVADSLGFAATHGLQISCHALGSTQDADPCVHYNSGASARSPSWILSVLGFAFFILM